MLTFHNYFDQQFFCLFIYRTLMIEYLGVDRMSGLNFSLIMFAYMICYTFAYVSLVKNYYIIIVSKFLANIDIENSFKKALVLTLINNIPRYIAYFIFTGIKNEDTASMLNGVTLLSMTVSIALSILSSKRSCFLSKTSFFKDFVFIEISLLYQCVYFQEENVENIFLCLALILFGVFLINTFRMSGYLSTDEFVNPEEQDLESTYKKIHEYTTKKIFDVLVLNSEENSKFLDRVNYRIFFSPFINALILIGVIEPFRNFKGLIVGGFSSLLFGILLLKCSKKQESGLFLNIYGGLASILYIFLFTNGIPYILNITSRFYEIDVNYPLITAVPIFISLPEILSVLYFAQKNLFNLAVCSILYSVIFNILGLHTLKLIFKKGVKTRAGFFMNRTCFAYCIITTIVFVFNYIMKNQKLSRDLAYILLFIYFLFHLTYVLDFNFYVKRMV